MRRFDLLLLPALGALLVLLPSGAMAQGNNITIVCPQEIDLPGSDTYIEIPIRFSCDVNIGGFTIGFHFDSDDIEIDSFHTVGTDVPVPALFQPPLVYADDNLILTGWTDFTFVNPIPPTVDGLLLTLVATVPAGTPAQCVNVDSAFVPPAGYFIYAPQAGGQITPTFTDCGTQEIDIGGACGEEPVPPVAACTDVTAAADGNCEGQASIDDGSYDPEGQEVTLTQEPPGPYPLGETQVSLIVTDIDGYADTCTGVVTVEDVTPPVIECPATVAVQADENCQALVPEAGSATDNCGGATITSDPPVGTALTGPGSFTVTLVATDNAGLGDTCDYTLSIVDEEAPQLTCPQDIGVTADPGQCSAVVEFAATATDNCSDPILSYDPTPGSNFPVGVTQVTVVATDGIKADSCTFNVTVTDVEAPVAQCPGDIEVNNDPGEQGALVSFTATVQDNCPGAAINCSPAPGSFFPLGETTVECIAEDASGNLDTCYFLVTVNFVNSPPVARDTTVVTNEDTPVGCQMQAYDPDGDPLTYAVQLGPLHGSISDFDLNTGSFTYTPDLGYLGPDTVSFKAFDGSDSSDVGLVAILVSGGGRAVIIPDWQYVYYAFAIEPRTDTVYFGNLPQGYTVADIHVPTISVNGSIVPTTATIVPGYPDFVGEVMCLTFPLPEFILPYMPLFDTTVQMYTVAGNYSDGMPFSVSGEVTLIGKRSTEPSQYIVPPDEVVLRGDVDKNGRLNLADATALINFIYGDGEPPVPRATADVDCSVSVNVADAVYLVGYIFGEQDAPCPVQP